MRHEMREPARILREGGGDYLNEAQLLALLIDVTEQRASEILERAGGLRRLTTWDHLQTTAGLQLTDAQARRLNVAVTFARRMQKVAERDKVTDGGPGARGHRGHKPQ